MSRYLTEKTLFSATLLGVTFALFILNGCSPANQVQTADRIIQKVSLDTPEPPKLCDDPDRPLPVPVDKASMLVYLFTEEHCDACARELDELNKNVDKLNKNNVLVIQTVTQTAGACFNAAKLARKSPWPYAASSDKIERDWALRSTPTLWLVDPKTHKTIAYIEGEISAGDLLDFIPK